MDAGKLIQDILQAGERAKSVVPCYMGKPYTATGKRPMQRRYQSLQSWYYSTMNAGKMES